MESVGDCKMNQKLRGKRKGKSAYFNNIPKRKKQNVFLYPPKEQVIEIVCAWSYIQEKLDRFNFFTHIFNSFPYIT